MGGRCWVSRGCARDIDPHAVCSPECKAGRTCPCTAFDPATGGDIGSPGSRGLGRGSAISASPDDPS